VHTAHSSKEYSLRYWISVFIFLTDLGSNMPSTQFAPGSGCALIEVNLSPPEMQRCIYMPPIDFKILWHNVKDNSNYE
jgi:hypothetical protein